ncbi:MAG: oxidoreductase [Thermoleophilia bacterium]|jgi:2,5-diketo-D-gluconate reductase A|nr:oxidoreductase [Thermoleophilia bacterium]
MPGMTSTTVPDVALSGGTSIPQLGYGVWQIPDAEAQAAVSMALDAGYRSIDTAAIYHNELGTGTAIRESDVPRDEIFLTTKLWNSEQGFDSTLAAFDASMERLGLDYVDLYLIHWPVASRDLYVDTWRAFERLLEEGRTRAIGVSNFQPPHLDRLLAECEVPPALNQVELHPWMQQAELRAYHAEHGIATEAWSPLGQGKLLDEPVIAGIAERLGVTSAQVILRWHIQLGNVVIPKSITPSRVAENFDIFGFELDGDDLAALARLDRSHRFGEHPDRDFG